MTISVDFNSQVNNQTQNPTLNLEEKPLKPKTQELLKSQKETCKNLYDQFINDLVFIPDPHLKPVKIVFHYSGTDNDIAETKPLGLV